MLARKRVMKKHEGMRLKCNGNIGELLKLPDCLCVSARQGELDALRRGWPRARLESGHVSWLWALTAVCSAWGSALSPLLPVVTPYGDCDPRRVNSTRRSSRCPDTDEELELFGQLDDRLGPFWFRHIWLCESTLFFFDAGFAMAFNATTLARLPECDMTIDFASPALRSRRSTCPRCSLTSADLSHAINRSGQLVELHDDLRDAFHAFDSRVHVDPFDFHVHDDRLYVLDSRYDDEEDRVRACNRSRLMDAQHSPQYWRTYELGIGGRCWQQAHLGWRRHPAHRPRAST